MNPQDTPQDYPQTAQLGSDAGTPQQQAIERLRTAVNVLVTVSNSPSVDQLSAAIGFTVLLNKMGKHATAVFSGDVPSTLEFLKPEDTLEKNTDSLRDFIVSLDKSKADKLRYKVEENVVKIFITPYKTSLSEADLNFSQGDFNVDAIVALGIAERVQLDQAIIAHGRILHDATVITVSAGSQGSSLGAVNWQDSEAASLCEMLVSVGDVLQPGLLDSQIATAYLTGIVAQTERFRNEKTTPRIMTIAANLLAAGANQQLIASSLEVAKEVPPAAEIPAEEKPQSADGELNIEHDANKTEENVEKSVAKAEPMEDSAPIVEEEKADESNRDGDNGDSNKEQAEPNTQASRQMLPTPGGNFTPMNQDVFGGGPHTFGAKPDDGMDEPNSDPMTAARPADRILDHSNTNTLPPLPNLEEASAPLDNPVSELSQAPVADISSQPVNDTPDQQPTKPEPEILTVPPAFDQDTLHSIETTFDSPHITKDPTSTLDEIEKVLDSPHLAEAPQQADVVGGARDAVQNAIAAAPYDEKHPEPMQALNANPLSDPVSVAVPDTQDQSAATPQAGDTQSDPLLASLGLTGADFTDNSVPSSPMFGPITTPPLPPAQPVAQVNADPSGQSPPPVPPPLLPVR